MVVNKRVYLAQLKCPSNHCVLACAGECSTAAEVEALEVNLREAFALMTETEVIDAWCGLCKSRDLHVHNAATPYATMAEAETTLRGLEREQRATAEYFRAGRN